MSPLITEIDYKGHMIFEGNQSCLVNCGIKFEFNMTKSNGLLYLKVVRKND